jgi:hypothetical protein
LRDWNASQNRDYHSDAEKDERRMR